MHSRQEAQRLAVENAASGLSVVWFAMSSRQVANDFKDVVRAVDASAVSKANVAAGRQRLRFHSGGCLAFMTSAGQGMRGIEADVVLVDPGTYRSMSRMESIIPMSVSASGPSPLITYSDE